ncbi:hypothetical protein ACLK1X_09350 [Escherichia coli]
MHGVRGDEHGSIGFRLACLADVTISKMFFRHWRKRDGIAGAIFLLTRDIRVN